MRLKEILVEVDRRTFLKTAGATAALGAAGAAGYGIGTSKPTEPRREDLLKMANQVLERLKPELVKFENYSAFERFLIRASIDALKANGFNQTNPRYIALIKGTVESYMAHRVNEPGRSYSMEEQLQLYKQHFGRLGSGLQVPVPGGSRIINKKEDF